MVVSLPWVLTDGAGFVWDVQTDGRIKDGSDDAFDGAFDNPDLRVVSGATTELEGRQLVLTPGSAISNPLVSLERRIYVPEDQAWARFIDSATNTSLSTTDYTFRLITNYGSDTWTDVVADSSGDGELGTSDWYFITDDGNPTGGDPFVGLLYSSGAVFPDSAAFSSVDIVELSLTVTLAPGETLSFMSFGFQSNDIANLEAALDSPLTADMTHGLSNDFAETVVNFDFEGYFEQVEYFGNDGVDFLNGSPRDESFFAAAGNDVILAGAGDDVVHAGQGDDVVSAGDGQDRVFGGAGQDVIHGGTGADLLDGDTGAVQTASATLTLSGGGESVQLLLSAPFATQDTSILVEGAVSNGVLGHGDGNFVFILDTSASMLDLYSGSDPVADHNGDGTANQLIDMEIAEFATLHHSLMQSGLSGADIAVIGMGDTAEVLYRGTLGSSLKAWHDIQPNGASDFEAALRQALIEFERMGAGTNTLYILSDGLPANGLSYVDEAAVLRDEFGFNTTIRAVPFGPPASQFDLDLMDDGLANLSLTTALNRAEIAEGFRRPAFDISELLAIEIYVNGTPVASLDPTAMEQTPFGVRFSFEVFGLLNQTDDVIEARLITADAITTVSLDVIDEPAFINADTLDGGDGQDTLLGQQGNDVLLGSDGHDGLDGGLGNDRMDGGPGDDALFGGAGDDILSGGQGADVLQGGAGQDTLSYAGSAHRVVVNLGNQTASGGDADGDQIDGFEHVHGTAQNDSLTGNYLDNLLRGGLGDDWLFGRGGFDTADYSDAAAGVSVSLKLPNGTQDTLGAGIDQLHDIEALIGSQFDDLLVGDGGYNELFGGAGDDVLMSKGGNDRLIGGSGNDHLFGNSGAERFIAGAGNDIVNGYSGADVLFGGTGNDRLYGDNGMDEIYGQGGDDILRGGPGFDFLDGGRGADDLRGSRGNDQLFGGGGNDYLGGDEGNDVLDGQSGNDVLLGGVGADLFRFSGAFGFDVLRDFTPGTDQLDVRALDVSDFSDFQSRASETTSGLRVDFGNGNVIFLDDLVLSDITADDVMW